MSNFNKQYQAAQPLEGKDKLHWRSLQFVFFAIGLVLFLLLIVMPETGVLAFGTSSSQSHHCCFALDWFWRNVCPLASVALIPHHLKISKNRRIPLVWHGRLALASVLLLFLIVPARHLALNNDGLATAITLAVLGTMAFVGGLFFDVKSAWCSSLAPCTQWRTVWPKSCLYAPKRPLHLPPIA
ncbi:MAG: hypothetical protein IPN76_30810 [Saprospiraceae bacterium]|nr:hypothetical protein [Saprospiraceae bacterium]